MKTNDEIKKFLSGLKTNVDILYYVDVEKIDAENAFDSISEMIEENGGFDKEVIYLNNAINFLAENDPSLQDRSRTIRKIQRLFLIIFLKFSFCLKFKLLVICTRSKCQTSHFLIFRKLKRVKCLLFKERFYFVP